MKKILAAILLLTLLLSAVACSSNDKPTEVVNAVPTTQPVPQKEYTTQNIVDIYNQAVANVEAAKSYQMDGSVSSTAVMGEMMATVVTSIDCDYADDNGNPKMRMYSSVNTDGNVKDHTTYCVDGRYYFELVGLKYYTQTNDYTDFHAAHYLKQINAKNIRNLAIRDESDGSCSVQFEVPYGVYQSEAISGWLGGFVSETVDLEYIGIKAVIDAEGMMKDFYMSFATSMVFGTETVEQTVIVSMRMSGYDATEVVLPTDLDTYENWNENESDVGGQNPDGEHDHGDNPGLNGDFE